MPPIRRRRALLAALLLITPAAGVTQQPAPRSVAEREQTADQQIRHALARLTFGARPGDYERVRQAGLDQWMEAQLDPRRIPDPEPQRLLGGFETLHLPIPELIARFPQRQQQASARTSQARRLPVGTASDSMRVPATTRDDSIAFVRAARQSQGLIADVQMARVVRALTSERQLEEVMVDFWLNHFNVFAGKGPERYFVAAYEREAIRPHAMGSFRDLLEAVAKSPAMLFYLDNWQSSVEEGRPALTDREGATARRRMGRRQAGRRNPVQRDSMAARLSRVPRGLNENYARELLELHTLGVDGGYTQEDVVNVARAFTGWSLERPRERGGFIFRTVMHDAGDKTVLGTRLQAGRGIEDGEQVLDIVSGHPATASFIAGKLARRFVSDSPPPALVERAAATFTRTNGDIGATLREIVTSPEFFSSDAYRAKVKSPFELVVSALRAMNAAADTTPRTARVLAALGQPLYMHQAPNGYPETGGAWINTGTILNRINFGLAIAGGRFPGLSIRRWPEAAALRDAPRAAQVDGVVRALLGGEVSPDTRRILETGVNPMLDVAGADTLAADLDPPIDTDGASDERRARPGRRGHAALTRPAELDGLAQVIGLALGSPEFQHR